MDFVHRPAGVRGGVPSRRRLAALLVVLAVLAASWSGTTVAGADDGHQPDQQLIADVRGYARETHHGYVHVLRWMKVLETFGALEGMTAAEAQANADTHLAERWDPVVEELSKLESAQGGYEPDQRVVADVRGYARETHYGYDHVLRWMRVLSAFGALGEMTAAEAQGYADRGWPRWIPVAAELAEMEASASGAEAEPPANRAPLVNQQTYHYFEFSATGNAPRGVLVSKGFAGLFSDPDGDDLTYTFSLPDDLMPLVDLFLVNERIERVFFIADDRGDWDAVEPALPEQVEFPVSVTATDPGGLSATVSGAWLTWWEPQSAPVPDCELLAPSSVSGLGIEEAAVISWTVPDNQADACEVTGFAVGAVDSQGSSFEDLITDPEARKHTLRGLTPDDYWFYVRVEYGEGTSDEVVSMEQNTVPATCDVTLTLEPYARNAISGGWTNAVDTPTGCVAGPYIEIHFKRSSDDHYEMYGKFPNSPQTDPDLPSFIFGGLKPYVGYDFKIVAVDAADQEHESNVANATIVSNDPSATADANSPGGVRVYANNHSDASVTWGLPDVASGRTLSAYVVEWKAGDGAAMTAEVPSDSDLDSNFQKRLFRISGLTDGAAYTVRVAARTYETGDASMTTSDAWSVPAPAVTAWSEPTRVWFGETGGITTPVYNAGRAHYIVFANKIGVIQCRVSIGGTVSTRDCPYNTLVSDVGTGAIEISAIHSLGGVETRSSETQGHGGGPGAPPVYASGGNGKLLVVWGEVATSGAVGTIDAYIVQHRLSTSATWTDTEITDTDQRTHTITGLSAGTWQVRVRARTDGNDDDDMTTDTPRLGFTSEVLTVTTHILSTLPPDAPIRVEATPGDSQSLIVEWEPPEASNRRGPAHAYQVRHQLGNTGAWTESEVLYLRQIRRICPEVGGCSNPRRYEITGLTAGENYNVAVRAHNVNGPGEWKYAGGQNIPNN